MSISLLRSWLASYHTSERCRLVERVFEGLGAVFAEVSAAAIAVATGPGDWLPSGIAATVEGAFAGACLSAAASFHVWRAAFFSFRLLVLFSLLLASFSLADCSEELAKLTVP